MRISDWSSDVCSCDLSTGEKRGRDARKLLSRLDTGTPIRIGDVSDGKPASAEVTPQIDQTVYVLQGDGSLMRAEGNVRMLRDDDGQLQVTADSFDVAPAPGVPPKVRHEIIRIGPGPACKGKDCGTPALMSAFRWNGLNLATVAKPDRKSTRLNSSH